MRNNAMYNEAVAHPLRYHVKCLIEAFDIDDYISLSNIKIYKYGGSLYCPYCGGQYSEESLMKESNEIIRGEKNE